MRAGSPFFGDKSVLSARYFQHILALERPYGAPKDPLPPNFKSAYRRE
jgi:hypothetical protein